MKNFAFCFKPTEAIDLKWIGAAAAFGQKIWLSSTEEQAR